MKSSQKGDQINSCLGLYYLSSFSCALSPQPLKLKMLELLAQTSTTATLCAVVAVSAFALHTYLRIQARKYPPGPAGDPLIGNLRHMPDEHPWLYYTDLKKKYGS